MIDVTEAVQRSMDFLHDMYDTADYHDILLEEVELMDDKKNWNVTIGFNRPIAPLTEKPLTVLSGTSVQYKREFKVFTISCNDGSVESMKMRPKFREV